MLPGTYLQTHVSKPGIAIRRNRGCAVKSTWQINLTFGRKSYKYKNVWGKIGFCMVRVTQVCSLAMCCRAPSIPEAQDLSRSSSNASSFASVVEEHENEHEAEEEYDTGLVRGDKQSFTTDSASVYNGSLPINQNRAKLLYSWFHYYLSH